MSLVGLHVEQQTDRAKAFYIYERGFFEALDRQEAISALPQVEWKGKKLRTIRCVGTSGKGQHDCNVPEGLLWSLMDITRFRCPYHGNDFLVD